MGSNNQGWTVFNNGVLHQSRGDERMNIFIFQKEQPSFRVVASSFLSLKNTSLKIQIFKK